MKIVKIIRTHKRIDKDGDEYMLVDVQAEDGEFYQVYVGGEAEEYLSRYDKPMLHVKWGLTNKSTTSRV